MVQPEPLDCHDVFVDFLAHTNDVGIKIPPLRGQYPQTVFQYPDLVHASGVFRQCANRGHEHVPFLSEMAHFTKDRDRRTRIERRGTFD